jgi:hypothetical protein
MRPAPLGLASLVCLPTPSGFVASPLRLQSGLTCHRAYGTEESTTEEFSRFEAARWFMYTKFFALRALMGP